MSDPDIYTDLATSILDLVSFRDLGRSRRGEDLIVDADKKAAELVREWVDANSVEIVSDLTIDAILMEASEIDKPQPKP